MQKILVISAFTMAMFVSCANSQQVKPVESKEVAKMLAADKNLIVLDVRTPGEFNSGHIQGALNIDISQGSAPSQLDKLDPKATYIVLCRTKNRSKTAVDYMEQKGFKNLYQMMDGMVGWIQNQLPISKL